MADKMIDGGLAAFMMTAVKAFTHLERDMREVECAVCYREGNLSLRGWSESARKHCRELMRALEMVEFCDAKHHPAEVVNLGKHRKENE